jgi:hypothetical protein
MHLNLSIKTSKFIFNASNKVPFLVDFENNQVKIFTRNIQKNSIE